jgi:hypothetical protein
MGKIIGINQRISVTLIEKGLNAVFDGVYSREFARALAEYEFHGENRLKKAVNELSKVVEKNAIIPFLLQHKEEVTKAMQYKADKAIIIAALYNAAFPFSYEEVCILGKYFHVQDQVSRNLLKEKISEIYGFNKSISNAIDYSIPTLVEAGFIERPVPGIYTKSSFNVNTEIALAAFRESFFINNPLLNRNIDYEGSPYFEFVR